jgi:hypothetical protein
MFHESQSTEVPISLSKGMKGRCFESSSLLDYDLEIVTNIGVGKRRGNHLG